MHFDKTSSPPPPYSSTELTTQRVPQDYPPPFWPCAFLTPIPQLSNNPQLMNCPHCEAEIETKVTTRSDKMAHIYALIICLLGGCCCFCIPYSMESLKNVEHSCPNCQLHIGTCKR